MKQGLVIAAAVTGVLTVIAAMLRVPDANASLGFSPSVRIPIVRAHGRGDPKQAALFSHWSHDQYPCYGCHPSLFPQQRAGFTHDELDDGRFCAACHNGKIAWSVDDAPECETCHRE